MTAVVHLLPTAARRRPAAPAWSRLEDMTSWVAERAGLHVHGCSCAEDHLCREHRRCEAVAERLLSLRACWARARKRHAATPDADIASDLAASVAVLEACKRVHVIAGHALRRDAECACGERISHRCCMGKREDDDMRACVEVYGFGDERYCSLECCAYAVLWRAHETQRQDAQALDFCTRAIERALGGEHD